MYFSCYLLELSYITGLMTYLTTISFPFFFSASAQGAILKDFRLPWGGEWCFSTIISYLALFALSKPSLSLNLIFIDRDHLASESESERRQNAATDKSAIKAFALKQPDRYRAQVQRWNKAEQKSSGNPIIYPANRAPPVLMKSC